MPRPSSHKPASLLDNHMPPREARKPVFFFETTRPCPESRLTGPKLVLAWDGFRTGRVHCSFTTVASHRTPDAMRQSTRWRACALAASRGSRTGGRGAEPVGALAPSPLPKEGLPAPRKGSTFFPGLEVQMWVRKSSSKPRSARVYRWSKYVCLRSKWENNLVL